MRPGGVTLEQLEEVLGAGSVVMDTSLSNDGSAPKVRSVTIDCSAVERVLCVITLKCAACCEPIRVAHVGCVICVCVCVCVCVAVCIVLPPLFFALFLASLPQTTLSTCLTLSFYFSHL